jgi:DNA sulfur modification protein DndD
MNGAGKTTIINSVLLLLYGKRSSYWQNNGTTYAKHLKSCACNNDTLKETWIELTFIIKYIEEKVKYRVRRSWSTSKQKLNEDLKVWRNEIDDIYLASNWDYYVEELVPLGVSSLFFFDGEKIARLTEDEDNTELQKAIHSLLGIDIIDRLISDLGRIKSDKEWDILNKYQNNVLIGIKEKINEFIVNRNLNNQRISELTKDILRLEADIKKLEKEYLSKGGMFDKKKAELEEERSRVIDCLGIIKGKLINITAGLLPLIMLKPLLIKTKETVLLEEEADKAKLILPALIKREAKFTEILQSHNIGEEIINKIKNQFQDEISDLKEISDTKTTFNNNQIVHQQIMAILGEQGDNILFETMELFSDYERTIIKLEQIERQTQLEIDGEKISSIVSQIKVFSDNIVSLKEERIKEETRKKELEMLESKYKQELISGLQKDIGSDNTRRIIDYAYKSIGLLMAFKERLTAQKIGTLEDNINISFNNLIQKKSLVSKITIDQKSLKLTLYDPKDNILPRTQLSEGEKQILAIAFLNGLASSSGRDLPIIIDTPMARLDSTHRMNFVENYLPFSSHQVVVLSTDEEIIGNYLQVIEKYIGQKYLLEYDDNKRATSVIEGYFDREA